MACLLTRIIQHNPYAYAMKSITLSPQQCHTTHGWGGATVMVAANRISDTMQMNTLAISQLTPQGLVPPMPWAT